MTLSIPPSPMIGGALGGPCQICPSPYGKGWMYKLFRPYILIREQIMSYMDPQIEIYNKCSQSYKPLFQKPDIKGDSISVLFDTQMIKYPFATVGLGNR